LLCLGKLHFVLGKKKGQSELRKESKRDNIDIVKDYEVKKTFICKNHQY